MLRFVLSMILFASLLYGCGKQTQTANTEPSVVVASAVKKDLILTREVIGQTKAYDSVELVARVQGILTKRLFKEGQYVKKGDLLFEFEKDEYEADLKSAEAGLLKSQAQYDNTLIEYNRNKLLIGKKAIAEREFDYSTFLYKEAKAALMASEAEVEKAKIVLDRTSIFAPFDGKIGLSYISVGDLVESSISVASSGSKLAVIVSIDPMRVQFNISELQLLSLTRQMSSFEEASKHAIVRIKFQDGTMYDQTGSLYFSDNSVNASTGTILTEALFPNKEGKLMPGYYVNVTIERKEPVSAIVIPQRAIMENQDGTSVYVVGENNVISLKKVKTGIVSAPYIEITEGLGEGDLVVIEGLQNLKSGIKVTYAVDKAYSVLAEQTDGVLSKSDTQRQN